VFGEVRDVLALNASCCFQLALQLCAAGCQRADAPTVSHCWPRPRTRNTHRVAGHRRPGPCAEDRGPANGCDGQAQGGGRYLRLRRAVSQQTVSVTGGCEIATLLCRQRHAYTHSSSRCNSTQRACMGAAPAPAVCQLSTAAAVAKLIREPPSRACRPQQAPMRCE
jgi:hypothetical protein